MTEIRFYHLEYMSLEQALPRILMMAFERGMRSVVKFKTQETLERLNTTLWTFQPETFLPHAYDHNAKDQPIWLTLGDDQPNKKDDADSVLILTENTTHEKIDDYDLCCLIFDGSDEASLTHARTQWKAFKDTDHTLKYFQQTNTGGWQEKAL